MSSFFSNNLERETRLRKQWRQISVLHNELCSGTTLSRIEHNHQTPSLETMEKLMREMGFPVDHFFCPYLVNQTVDVFIMRDKLLDSLSAEWDTGARAEAANLLEQFEKMDGFSTGINRQFILSCKTRLLEMNRTETSEVMALINEGLFITYPEFNEDNFSKGMLIFEEIELLHTLSLTYFRSGKPAKAIKLLEDVVEGLRMLPEDDQEKEKKLAKVLLTLSDFLMSQKDYEKALAVCERGNTASLKWNKGKYTPDFVFNKGICSFHLGRSDKCTRFFILSYFGYELLHKRDNAEKVRREAKRLCGIIINTYGVDSLEYERQAFLPFAYGKLPLNCESLGELIGMLRVQEGMSLNDLCNGLCNRSTLYRIETGGHVKNSKYAKSGVKQPSIYLLEALMQRLGRDIDLYFSTFLSKQNFLEKQMRNEVHAFLGLWKYKEAEELLAELETKKDFKSGINLQFILRIKAVILSGNGEYGRKYFDMVIDALKATRPDFDEDRIGHYRLTHNEILLINLMAFFYSENKNIPQAAKTLERLRDSINKSYVDEAEKIKTYLIVLYNYSMYLGLLERYDEALTIIAEGDALALKHRYLTMLPGFALNKACDLLEMGKEEESIPFFAFAFYGSALVNKEENQRRTGNYVEKKLNFIFN